MGRRVLLVGATGAFGTRLATRLSTWSDIELVLAARRLAPLEALSRDLGGTPVAVFDREDPSALADLAPWAVIDAAGPFQMGDHRLARAALAAGAHYIDLADGRAFVADFPAALDAAARAAGKLAITGASSTPALSAAALDEITAGWTRIDTVNVAISPGAKAPRGRSVTRAILSYVGRPVRVFLAGRWQTRPGWGLLRRQSFPGLGPRWTALCETPDLDMVPARFAPREASVFRAGLELSPLHLGLWALSWLTRLRLIRSLEPAAGPLTDMAGWVAGFGTDRSGMIVEAEGLGPGGERRAARWALWAEANAGPTVPTAAAAAVLRRLLDGSLAEPGARACVGVVGLGAILAELEGLPVFTRIDAAEPQAKGLFRRVMGVRFEDLPASVRRLHNGETPESFAGQGRARGSRGLLPRLARLAAGLPEPGAYPVEVRVAPDDRGETWTRRFGRYAFQSRLRSRPEIGRFEEAFGALRFAFEADRRPNGFTWRFVGWRLGPVPLPKTLAPRMHARAVDDAGVYRFRVAMDHPLTGLVFAYAGTLEPAAEATAPRAA